MEKVYPINIQGTNIRRNKKNINGRKKLFPEPEDTYKSSVMYVHLMKKQSKEELLEEFGCLWEDYMP